MSFTRAVESNQYEDEYTTDSAFNGIDQSADLGDAAEGVDEEAEEDEDLLIDPESEYAKMFSPPLFGALSPRAPVNIIKIGPDSSVINDATTTGVRDFVERHRHTYTIDTKVLGPINTKSTYLEFPVILQEWSESDQSHIDAKREQVHGHSGSSSMLGLCASSGVLPLIDRIEISIGSNSDTEVIQDPYKEFTIKNLFKDIETHRKTANSVGGVFSLSSMYSENHVSEHYSCGIFNSETIADMRMERPITYNMIPGVKKGSAVGTNGVVLRCLSRNVATKSHRQLTKGKLSGGSVVQSETTYSPPQLYRVSLSELNTETFRNSPLWVGPSITISFIWKSFNTAQESGFVPATPTYRNSCAASDSKNVGFKYLPQNLSTMNPWYSVGTPQMVVTTEVIPYEMQKAIMDRMASGEFSSSTTVDVKNNITLDGNPYSSFADGLPVDFDVPRTMELHVSGQPSDLFTVYSELNVDRCIDKAFFDELSEIGCTMLNCYMGSRIMLKMLPPLSKYNIRIGSQTLFKDDVETIRDFILRNLYATGRYPSIHYALNTDGIGALFYNDLAPIPDHLEPEINRSYRNMTPNIAGGGIIQPIIFSPPGDGIVDTTVFALTITGTLRKQFANDLYTQKKKYYEYGEVGCTTLKDTAIGYYYKSELKGSLFGTYVPKELPSNYIVSRDEIIVQRGTPAVKTVTPTQAFIS